MSMFENLRKALLAGFGAQEKVKEMINEFVEKGELSKSQGAKLVREWTERAEKGSSEVGKTVSETIKKTMDRMNLPTKDDIDSINRKLKTLSDRVKKLEGGAKEE